MQNNHSSPAHLLRKLRSAIIIASAVLASAFGAAAIAPLSAQVYSNGYKFLEAVDERDGDTATEMLNEPGTTVINTRDITSGDTGLHLVAARRDVVWVKFLLQRGADPNIRNKKGQTPIQVATTLGFVDGVEELIKRGAQVNVSDQQGETPLISAVHQRNIPLIRMFLEKGADPDRNDNSGRSARDYANLMISNSQILREFEKADEERKKNGAPKQYGPSF